MRPKIAALRFTLATIVVVLFAGFLAQAAEDSRLEPLRTLIKAGRYADAENGARPLLAEVESSNGVDSMEAAAVLDVLVESLWRGGKSTDSTSLAFAQRAVLIKEKALGPLHLDMAISLNNLANLLRETGDNAAARPMYERVLAIREKALGPDHPDVAKTLNSLALLLQNAGDYSGARPLYERAVATMEKALGPEHPDVARILTNLAYLLYQTSDFAGARPLYERALMIREKALGRDNPLVASSANNLAILLYETADYAGARQLYERALGIREKVLGPDHPDVADSLNGLAIVMNETGDYAGARPLYERAQAIRERAFGPDHPLVAMILDNLASLLADTGDYKGAQARYERALAIKERTLGADDPEVATSLNNLAVLLEKANQPGARPLFERSLAIREKALGSDNPAVAAGLTNLGHLLAVDGDYAGARPLLERALAISAKALGPDHVVVAADLDNLASLLADTGDYAGARPLFEHALSIRKKALGPDHPDVGQSLNRLAALEAFEGETGVALNDALEAERIGREHLRLTVRSLSERQALRYAAVRTSGLDLALTLAAHGLDAASRVRVLDALIRSRAVVLDEMAARHRTASATSDPELARRGRALDAARTRLANLVVRGAGGRSSEVYRQLLDGAHEEMERAEREIAAASAPFARELAHGRVGFDEVAASLPSGCGLIAFAQYRKIDLSSTHTSAATEIEGVGAADKTTESVAPERSKEQTRDVSSYIAFVLRSGGREPQVVDLGLAREVDAMAARWHKEAAGGTQRSQGRRRQADAAYREAGTPLRRSVWDPVAAALGDMTRVFVIPDGALNLVNVAALPNDDGGYLIEHGLLVHYVSAERDLVRSGEHGVGEGLLAMGMPDYDATSVFASLRKHSTSGSAASPPGKQESVTPATTVASITPYRGSRAACGAFASLQFDPLPATGMETREIARLWTRYGGAQPLVTGPETKGAVNTGVRELPLFDLHGAAASETALKRIAAGRRVLHLATHGFFLAGKCESAMSGAAAASGSSRGPLSEKDAPLPPLTGENPLLLSGLAFAGANRRAAASAWEDDGILTAEEIASLDLSGVEWAVLSACETGLGDVRAGEGVFGLRRAFEVAGARTLIMSLWEVEDSATRAWMRALYEERFVRHLDTAEAVREASRSILQRRRARGQSTHPFYWGAFVAAGNWN